MRKKKFRKYIVPTFLGFTTVSAVACTNANTEVYEKKQVYLNSVQTQSTSNSATIKAFLDHPVSSNGYFSLVYNNQNVNGTLSVDKKSVTFIINGLFSNKIYTFDIKYNGKSLKTAKLQNQFLFKTKPQNNVEQPQTPKDNEQTPPPTSGEKAQPGNQPSTPNPSEPEKHNPENPDGSQETNPNPGGDEQTTPPGNSNLEGNQKLNNSSEKENNPNPKKDNFSISNVSWSNVNATDATLNLNFSNHSLADAKKNNLLITISDGQNHTQNLLITESSTLSTTFYSLKPNTTYTLTSVSLNGNSLALPSSNLSFTTSQQQIEPNTPTKEQKIYHVQNSSISNIQSDKARINVSLDTSLDASDNVTLSLQDANGRRLDFSNPAVNNTNLIFDVYNLASHTTYYLDNIQIGSQNISLNNQTFTTSDNSVQFNALNYSLLDSFTKYDEQVSKFNAKDNLHIKEISLINNKMLWFAFDHLPTSKNNDFKFTFNGQNYTTKYNGTSQNILVDVSNGNSNNTISNIMYANQAVEFSGSVKVINKTGTTATSNVSSFSINNNKVNVNVSYLPNQSNDKYLITIKPDVNVYDADIAVVGTYKNGHIESEGIINFNQGYNKYIITDVTALNNNYSFNVPEEVAWSSNQTFNPTITKIQFALSDASTNTYVGAINLNATDSEVEQFKNKYVKLTFVDLVQKNTPADTDDQKRSYGYSSDGGDWFQRQFRQENTKSVFLNFDELKKFSFTGLTEGITWKLNQVQIVNKYDLSSVIDYDDEGKDGDSKHRKLSLIQQSGTTELKPSLDVSKNAYSDALGTSFSQTNLNITNNSQYQESQLTDNTNGNVPKSIPFNWHNYITLNNAYLKNTLFLTHYSSDINTYVATAYTQYNNPLPVIEFDNHKEYNFAAMKENVLDKEMNENSNRTEVYVEKDIRNFKNLDSNKEAIINFSFVASPKQVNFRQFSFGSFDWAVSFSWNKLNAAANKTISDIKIKFLGKTEDLLKKIGRKIDSNDSYHLTLTDQQLEDLMNKHLKAQVSLSGDKLKISLIAREGHINKDMYIHNLSSSYSTFVDKTWNYLSIMYLKNGQPLSFTNEHTKAKNQLKIDGFEFDKETKFKSIGYNDDSSGPVNIEVTTWYTNSSPRNTVQDDVITRSFGTWWGTAWMIGKVDPDNENDNRYYFGTNIHVPVLNPGYISAPKPHTSKEDVSLFLGGYWSNTGNSIFWTSDNNNNKSMDGSLSNVPAKNRTDFKIHIIDITELINYYNQHKSDANKENDPKFKTAEHIYKWKSLKHNKVSKMGRYIHPYMYYTMYMSSFPGSTTYNTKKNIQVRQNFIGDILFYPGDKVPNAKTEKVGFIKRFKNSSGEIINVNANYQLTGGSSGTGLYDHEGNFLGIHANEENGEASSYLLSSQRINFFGELNDYNNGSFAYKVQRLNRLYPKKHKMLDIFNEFENPIKK
ncbi:hypothetical protein ACXYRP_00800 [Mycoplasma sp. 5912]